MSEPTDQPAEATLKPTRHRFGQIKGLPVILPERGKIKIGMKGKTITSRNGNEFQPPKKLDHFIITTMTRGDDNNFLRDEAIHKALGDKPKTIPIRLLFDDIDLNMQSRYVAYVGKTMWCTGDGETAQRLVANAPKDAPARETVTCPCHRSDPAYTGQDRCKINGKLSVLIDHGAAVGGVWTFRTTSYNSVTGLLASLNFLQSVTRGPLAGIPLDLVVSPKSAADPSGAQQTVYVVSVEYRGSIEDLTNRGYSIALERAKAGVMMTQVEATARHLLALPAPENAPFAGDDAADVVEEFYPEQAGAEQAAPPAPTREEVAAQAEQASELIPMIDGDGEEKEYAPADYRDVFIAELEARAKAGNWDGMAGFWDSNSGGLRMLAQRDDALYQEINQAYERLAAPPPTEPNQEEPWAIHRRGGAKPGRFKLKSRGAFFKAFRAAQTELGFSPTPAEQLWRDNESDLRRMRVSDQIGADMHAEAALFGRKDNGWPDAEADVPSFANAEPQAERQS